MHLWWWGRIALVAAVFAAFWTALSGGFVWDDARNLVQNTHFRGWGAAQLRWCLTAYHEGHYQPLTWLSFMLDHALWGLDPKGFHLTNLALHAVNVLLFAAAVRLLIREAGRERTRTVENRAILAALVAAAVFALHPMRVESVAWITERRDVLCGVFFLLSILAYLRSVPSDRQAPLRMGWLAGSFALFLLSLFSKALGMGLPIVLLVMDAYPLWRWSADANGWARGAVIRSLLEKLPFACAAAVFGWLALRAQEAHGALVDTESLGWASRIAQAAYGVMYYVRATFAQISWSPLYERPVDLDPTASPYLLSSAGVIVLTALFVAGRRRFPAGLAVWISYIALLAPVLGFAQSGVQLVADRYSYLSCLGWAVLAGAGAAAWWNTARGTAGRVVCAASVVVVLGAWGSLTWRQTHVWHDDVRLWRFVLARGPSATAWNNLGAEALERRDFAAAVEWFSRALEVAPTYGRAELNLVQVLQGYHSELPIETLHVAKAALQRMVQLRPSHSQAWFLLGAVSLRERDFELARQELQRAVELTPGNARGWYYLGVALAQLHETEGALAAYHRALELDAGIGLAWLSLGELLASQGRCAEAIGPLQEATRLLPERTKGWTTLGRCLIETHDRAGAVTALRRALTLSPDDPVARSMLDALGDRSPLDR